jgi:hypothetical protein
MGLFFCRLITVQPPNLRSITTAIRRLRCFSIFQLIRSIRGYLRSRLMEAHYPRHRSAIPRALVRHLTRICQYAPQLPHLSSIMFSLRLTVMLGQLNKNRAGNSVIRNHPYGVHESCHYLINSVRRATKNSCKAYESTFSDMALCQRHILFRTRHRSPILLLGL